MKTKISYSPFEPFERLLSCVQRKFIRAKYELTAEILKVNFWDWPELYVNKNSLLSRKEVQLHRIRALIDIPVAGVKAGDLGGFVEGHMNLSHRGGAWVGKNGKAWNGAFVMGDGLVTDEANVIGVTVLGRITGRSELFGWSTRNFVVPKDNVTHDQEVVDNWSDVGIDVTPIDKIYPREGLYGKEVHNIPFRLRQKFAAHI